MEDNFFHFHMDRVGGMVQAVMQVMRSDGGRQVKLHSPAAHLLLL